MYTFTEQCEEIAGLHLEDGTKKIFLNMASRKGRPDLVSLLQYMKNTTLDNPEILVKDKRIRELDRIVREVKQSEEWEAVKMNILEIGIEKGLKEGKAEVESKIVGMIRKKREKKLDAEAIAEHLELDTAYVRKVVALMDEDSSRTDLQVARILVRQE